ncbi:helicase-exonuclease AddAB subunit AddB [Bacillus sp. CGMCC 1.16607]|uniref:helicase-exonuclease AddAB subunit AddB n=1 Tax=Bacillus sp. CGMCC 1.16607 TaxID=3351842 RepID=UPI00362E53E1
MSVRLLYGRSGSGKTTYSLNEIKSKLMEEPEGNPIIYLVPDQMTFLSEYRLISGEDINGMIRAQVFSFTRLAWRVLQETGGISRQHLTSVGLNMLIRKIIEEEKTELKIFDKAADKNGFIEQLEQMLTEFKRYCVQPNELKMKREALIQTGESTSRVLQDKLHDLELIYENFEQSLQQKYVDSEDYFRLLTEKAPSSSYIKNAEVYIDGFNSFTPQEYMIIAALMKNCKRVTIALTLDEPFYQQSPDELHLFRLSGETCQTIYEIAHTEGVEIEKAIPFLEQKRWTNDSLRHLETHFDTRPAIKYDQKSHIHIGQAVNRRAEVEGVARKIREFVSKTTGNRYREVSVLIRNGNEYREMLETVFEDYNIPYFIDQKRTMLHHPLIEFIRSTLEILYSNWRYEPTFRAIKTELLYPLKENRNILRQQADKLENYVLAYGIQGKQWSKKERWIYRKYKGIEFESTIQTNEEKRLEIELNEIRLKITAPILRLSRRLNKSLKTREYCEALFLFLEELDIPAKLEEWKLLEESKGNLVQAREHDQAWNAIIDLLDEYVEMLSEEELSLKQFATILDAGLETLRFSLVPPALDQVIVADLEKSRLSEMKATFVIGLNDGVFPAKFSDEGILADDDREQLIYNGLKIGPSSRLKLLDEQFLAYKAFTLPSEILYLTYPLANEEGKGLVPSPFINRIKELFPNHEEHYFVTDTNELQEKEQLEYAANKKTTLSHLTAQLQLKKRNYPIYDLWWDVYHYYLENEAWKQPTVKVLSSLFYTNQTVQISTDLTKELYGEQIQASVSRMELFHSCPFSHYAQYGLQLKERQIFRLEAPDIGELFHAALKYISNTIIEEKKSWAQMNRSDCEKLAKQAMDALAPRLQNEILLSSNRHHYIKRKLEQIISRASFVLSEHAKASGFSPIGLELGFGPKGELPALQFELNNGRNMSLVGRIDRIDQATNQDDIYLRVVDYKSSAKDVQLQEVYYGLALQMLTYLDIVITHSSKLVEAQALPAGVLYFHVHNPMVQSKKSLSIDQIEAEIFKRFKMNGLLLAEPEVLRLMDEGIDVGASKIIAAGMNKNGTLSKASKVATKEEFDLLRGHVRNMYVNTGNELVEGNVKIAPYKLKDKTPCTFCSFKPVCHFDQSIESNDYRLLMPQSKEKVLQGLVKGGESNV